MSFSIHPIGKKKSSPKKHLPWKSILSTGFIVGKALWSYGVRIHERQKRARMMKRVITMSAAGIFAFMIILVAGAMAIKVGMISVPSMIEHSGEPVNVDEHGFTNILLMGQGNEEHDGIDLTDTIIVASIDPENTESIALLSLPRDLVFLHTEKMGERKKLNEMWRDYRILLQNQGATRTDAGVESLIQLKKEIGTALGIDVHYVIKVDFTAFEKTIDLLGGIDLTVPETIDDTQYPGPNYSYQTFHIEKGFQHLDGETALKYARTRSTTSDFDRSARQQQILKNAATKAREEGLLKKPQKLLEMLAIYNEHVETDITTRQFITLARMGQKLDTSKLITMQLNNVNGLYGEQLFKGGILYSPPRDLFDGISVLLPVSIPEFPVTWKQVTALSRLFFLHRDLYLTSPQLAIFNGGARSGIAGKLGKEFKKFGFDLVEITNVPNMKKNKVPESAVVQINPEKNDQAAFLAKFLGFTLVTGESPLRARLAGEETGDIAIVLGENYTFEFLQDLSL